MLSPGSRVGSSAGLHAEGRPAAVEELSCYLDEDLSCLEYGARLLALAGDDAEPLLERVRLLALAARHLDQFFQLRGLHRRAVAAGGQGRALRPRVHDLLQRQSRLLRRLEPVLAAEGMGLCYWEALGSRDRQYLGDVFHRRLLPVLAPLVAGPGRSLPPPADLSLNVAVCLRDREGRERFGSVELPPVLARFVPLPDGRSVALEELVVAYLPVLFPGFEVTTHADFRVTRHAGPDPPPDAEDLLAATEAQLGRGRFGTAVRLEVGGAVPPDVLKRLTADLDLTEAEVYTVHGLLGAADVAQLARPGRPDLEAPPPGAAIPAIPAVPSRYGPDVPDLFSALEQGEVLVHAPYDPLATSVEAFLARAASAPGVVAIKQSLYRPVPDSPLVRSLAGAAERGVHVVALVELAAPLGERDSVACARALTKAGAHVVYGLVGLRTHCVATLVVARWGHAVRRYVLVSTNVPHSGRTAEGMSLLSADPALGADLADLFNLLTGYGRPATLRRLLAAPGRLRPGLLAHIRREEAAGAGGRIRLKVNRLVDREMVDALYAASRRGVAIDVVVAGTCALRPGVTGLSETIRVVTTAGRYPESSRLFAFGTEQEAAWYLSSADLAPRNLDRQVNVAVPVADPGVRERLDATFDALVQRPAWKLGPDGAWRRGRPGAEDRLADLAASGVGSRLGGAPRR